jgi:chromosome segregation ATPase
MDGLYTGAVANPEGVVTADLQARVIALEDETTSLRMVINHLEAENAQCSEKLAIVRLAIRELETLLLTPIAPDGKDQKKKVQSTKKTSSSRGDSPNSRKKKLRKQASDYSSEGDTSEEDDVHTHVGLGPAVPGLTELTTRRPELKELLLYRAYRLEDLTQKVDGAAHDRLSSLLRGLKYNLEEMFSGDPEIKVLDFLKS